MKSRFAGLVLVLVAGTNLALLIPSPHPLRYLAVFILLWVLPGMFWSFLMTGRGTAPAGEEMVIGLGLGVTTTTLLTMLLHYLPGRLGAVQLLVSADLLSVVFIGFVLRSAGDGPPWGVRQGRILGRWNVTRAAFAALVLIVVALRLVNLGYSEFQGDEGVIMVRAARALEGDDGALFLHQKGPVEILLPMATWRLSGTIDEFWARLPFAYAGILGVLAVAMLGRRLFGARAGWLAGLLMAISGYHVAFGRVVQYQSIVLLATGAALLALWRWAQGDRDRWLLAAAALLALGALAHYDAVLALPAALYLVARRIVHSPALQPRLPSPHIRYPLWPILTAALLGLALLATFYLPYALNPNFGKTFGYLSGERIGGGGPIYDNLGSSFVLTTVYNSTWYVVALILLVVVASAAVWRGLVRLAPLALVAVGVLSSVLAQGALLTFLALTLWCVSVLLARQGTLALRLAWLWFSAPFLFFHFLIWDPRTHVLNLFPGACLLAAFILAQAWRFVNVRWRQSVARHLFAGMRQVLAPKAGFQPLNGDLAHSSERATQGRRGRSRPVDRLTACARRSPLALPLALGVAFLGLSSYYPVWMFVDHAPEVLRTWPEHRHPLFPTVYDEIPPFGLFGFPHRAGWKAVGALYDAGRLMVPYASNEEVEVTGWYTRGAERTYCAGPDLYVVADQVQDEVPLDRADLRDHYHEAARVDRGGDTLLRLYTRAAAADPLIYSLSDWAGPFDAATTPDAVLPPPPADYVPIEATLNDQVRLLGYRLGGVREGRVTPGDTFELVLYWEALAPLEHSYHVFTHLYGEGEMWGQADSIPQCGLWPTLRWQPGEVVADRYRLTLRPDTPVGPIPLTVGMYTLPDGARLPIRDAQGEVLGDALPLTMLEVVP